MVAGPNGCGKSSILARINFEGKPNLLEADAIALRIDPAVPQRAAFAAGREMLRRTREYVRHGESFGIETTLSGNWTMSAVREALQQRFRVSLVYVCLDDPERCVKRVRERVARSGHDVPEPDIRRRYARSLAHAPELIRMADEVMAFDNSGTEPTQVFEMRAGAVVMTAPRLPRWATELLREA